MIGGGVMNTRTRTINVLFVEEKKHSVYEEKIRKIVETRGENL